MMAPKATSYASGIVKLVESIDGGAMAAEGEAAGEYNNLVAVDTFHLDGVRTLRENMPDVAGVLITLDAFK
jgi:hypothetical protein